MFLQIQLLVCGGGECLDAQLVEHGEQLLVQWLIRANSLRERHIYNLIVAHTNHHVALSLHDSLYGAYTSTACKYAVACCGASSTLQVSEY